MSENCIKNWFYDSRGSADINLETLRSMDSAPQLFFCQQSWRCSAPAFKAGLKKQLIHSLFKRLHFKHMIA